MQPLIADSRQENKRIPSIYSKSNQELASIYPELQVKKQLHINQKYNQPGNYANLYSINAGPILKNDFEIKNLKVENNNFAQIPSTINNTLNPFANQQNLSNSAIIIPPHIQNIVKSEKIQNDFYLSNQIDILGRKSNNIVQPLHINQLKSNLINEPLPSNQEVEFENNNFFIDPAQIDSPINEISNLQNSSSLTFSKIRSPLIIPNVLLTPRKQIMLIQENSTPFSINFSLRDFNRDHSFWEIQGCNSENIFPNLIEVNEYTNSNMMENAIIKGLQEDELPYPEHQALVPTPNYNHLGQFSFDMPIVNQNPFSVDNMKPGSKGEKKNNESNLLNENNISITQNENLKPSKNLTFAKDPFQKIEEEKIDDDNLPIFGPSIINNDVVSNQKELQEAISTIAQLRLEIASLKEKLKFLEDLLAKSQASQYKDMDKCQICNEEIADWVIFPCHDSFCEKCANSIIKKNCPICNSKVEKCKPLG